MPAAVVAVLTAYSVSEQRQARKAQQRAIKREKAISDAQAIKSQREAIRARIVQQAQIEATAANTGTTGSSGVEGGVASLGSQTGANIGLANQITALNNERLSFLNEASRREGNASAASSLASVAGSAGGYNQIANWFTSAPKSTG